MKPKHKYAGDPEWHDDIAYAMDAAAEFLDMEEFSGDDLERQEAAFREVAKRIRKMLARYLRKAK